MHDGEFSKRVPQDKLTRLLCAALHSFDEYGFSNENKKLTYVQGLNIPAGIFLYVMPELDAFFSFLRFVRTCPLYWTKDIEGAHNGLQVIHINFYSETIINLTIKTKSVIG